MLKQQTDRRVIPWVSIAILLNILFFFRSIAAPFFDPLVSSASCPFLCQLSMVYLTQIPLLRNLKMSSGRTPPRHCFLGIFLPACIPLHLVSISNCVDCSPPGAAIFVFCMSFFILRSLILVTIIRDSFLTTTMSSLRLRYSFTWYLRAFALCC